MTMNWDHTVESYTNWKVGESQGEACNSRKKRNNVREVSAVSVQTLGSWLAGRNISRTTEIFNVDSWVGEMKVI